MEEGNQVSPADDLELRICESYGIIREYERTNQVSDRPEERLRAQREIERQWLVIGQALPQYLAICQRLERLIPDDLQQVSALLDVFKSNRVAIASPSMSIEQSTRYSQDQSLALYQLPPDIADFTGRQAELDAVTALLEQASEGQRTAVVISAVAGMPGIGKSVLAIHVAHLLKDLFPDAQFYANLRGTEDRPQDPFDVLGSPLC